MQLNIAVQMNDIAKINKEFDTTLRLMWEIKKRGHKLYYYEPHNISLFNAMPQALMHEIDLQSDNVDYFSLSKAEIIDLQKMDIIFLRHDPPFNIEYLTSTYFLELLPSKTLIVNNPTEIRNCPEKIFVSNFPDYIPETIITANLEQIKNLLEKHTKIILKPLYSYAGKDVFFIDLDDKNIESIYDYLSNNGSRLLIAQQYLEQIKSQGDKRVIILNGEILGAYVRRISSNNSIKSNVAAGGIPEKVVLTDRDIEIAENVGHELLKRGILFAGLDIIGNHLTEINITSPTGIPVLNKLYDKKFEVEIIDRIEESYFDRKVLI